MLWSDWIDGIEVFDWLSIYLSTGCLGGRMRGLIGDAGFNCKSRANSQVYIPLYIKCSLVRADPTRHGRRQTMGQNSIRAEYSLAPHACALARCLARLHVRAKTSAIISY